MQSILIVRTSAIGDVVQTFPVIEYLRAKFPDARIDWVVEKGIAQLLRQLIGIESGKPLIDHVIEIDTKTSFKFCLQREFRQTTRGAIQTLRSHEYDLIFDVQGNTKSGVITSLARSKEKVGFNWQSAREKLNLLATTRRFGFPSALNIREKYLKLVQTYYGDETPFTSKGVTFQLTPSEQAKLKQILQNPLMQRPLTVMIAVGSKWKNKRIGDQLLMRLLKEGHSKTGAGYVLIYGNSEEKCDVEKLALMFPTGAIALGELSLPLWQVLMSHVEGIIAVDSAALHFAGTTQTPSFSFFGPTAAKIFKPLQEYHTAFQSGCPYGKTFLKQCPQLRTCATGACLQSLDWDEIKEPFLAWLTGLVPSLAGS